MALAALAWVSLGRGDAVAQAVREQAQSDGTRMLQTAGFTWSRLEVDDEVGRVVGEAPSLPQRAAAFAAAQALLFPMTGSPGVFARLEDAQTSALPGLGVPTPPAVQPAASGAAGATGSAPAASPTAAQASGAQPEAVANACEQVMAHLLQTEQIRFKVSSAELSPASQPLIRRLKDAAAGCPQARLQIQGHTDARGNAAANLALSKRRARAVVDALVREGVPASRLSAEGFGQTRPLDPGTTAEAYERNRRIELRLVPPAR